MGMIFSQAQADTVPASTAPGRRAAERSRPLSFTDGGSDHVAEYESRRDEPHHDLATGDESPLLSEPVALSRDATDPLLDQHGYLSDDVPEFLRREVA